MVDDREIPGAIPPVAGSGLPASEYSPTVYQVATADKEMGWDEHPFLRGIYAGWASPFVLSWPQSNDFTPASCITRRWQAARVELRIDSPQFWVGDLAHLWYCTMHLWVSCTDDQHGWDPYWQNPNIACNLINTRGVLRFNACPTWKLWSLRLHFGQRPQAGEELIFGRFVIQARVHPIELPEQYGPEVRRQW